MASVLNICTQVTTWFLLLFIGKNIFSKLSKLSIKSNYFVYECYESLCFIVVSTNQVYLSYHLTYCSVLIFQHHSYQILKILYYTKTADWENRDIRKFQIAVCDIFRYWTNVQMSKVWNLLWYFSATATTTAANIEVFTSYLCIQIGWLKNSNHVLGLLRIFNK